MLVVSAAHFRVVGECEMAMLPPSLTCPLRAPLEAGPKHPIAYKFSYAIQQPGGV